ncbi:MAG: hypothetical protein Q8O99_01195 [bacterium]|nr:hypothetical protein [bacterium]
MQILQITILIVVNILLLLFRRRLINQTVGTTHHGRRVVIISLIMSALFALFPQRSTLFHLPALHYAQITNFTSGTFRRTTGAALVVLFVMLYLGVRKLPTRSSWMMHLLFGILRLLIRRFVSPLLP